MGVEARLESVIVTKRLYAVRGAGGVRLSGGVSVSCAAVEDAEAAVVGVGVAESLAFDGFDDVVDAFGGSVGEAGVEVGEQLGFPRSEVRCV